jgi:hypothetical protein
LVGLPRGRERPSGAKKELSQLAEALWEKHPHSEVYIKTKKGISKKARGYGVWFLETLKTLLRNLENFLSKKLLFSKISF